MVLAIHKSTGWQLRWHRLLCRVVVKSISGLLDVIEKHFRFTMLLISFLLYIKLCEKSLLWSLTLIDATSLVFFSL